MMFFGKQQYACFFCVVMCCLLLTCFFADVTWCSDNKRLSFSDVRNELKAFGKISAGPVEIGAFDFKSVNSGARINTYRPMHRIRKYVRRIVKTIHFYVDVNIVWSENIEPLDSEFFYQRLNRKGDKSPSQILGEIAAEFSVDGYFFGFFKEEGDAIKYQLYFYNAKTGIIATRVLERLDVNVSGGDSFYKMEYDILQTVVELFRQSISL